jgi:hypothetical protein
MMLLRQAVARAKAQAGGSLKTPVPDSSVWAEISASPDLATKIHDVFDKVYNSKFCTSINDLFAAMTSNLYEALSKFEEEARGGTDPRVSHAEKVDYAISAARKGLARDFQANREVLLDVLRDLTRQYLKDLAKLEEKAVRDLIGSNPEILGCELVKLEQMREIFMLFVTKKLDEVCDLLDETYTKFEKVRISETEARVSEILTHYASVRP